MTVHEKHRNARRGRSSRRQKARWVVVVVVGLALAFLLGMAFAQTLDDRPASSGTVTDVRTLTPLPQGAPVRTVTVTVTTNP